ncbi:MAG TPA: hypothetical protein VND54_07715 [Candidatus Saccharimonadales bacterium]|nr:hypothetical protein [Candidatus Saccharimonadales bacterium]
MPDRFDPDDTRYLAERARAAQREQHRVTKAVAATVRTAHLPRGRQANVRKMATYDADGFFAGLVEPSRLQSARRVTKADAASPLRAVFDEHGNILGVVDPADLQGLAEGESFAYNADGMVTGIVGSDGKIRPVTPAMDPKSVAGRSAQDAAAANQRARDAAATVAANQPATAPNAPAAVVAKAAYRRPPMTWDQAMAILQKTRGTMERIRAQRVAKAMTGDTRDLSALADAERCLDALTPLLKMGPPPKPKRPDAETYLRGLGEAAIELQVRKSGKHIEADPMLVAATTYAAMPPNLQAEVRKALAKTSMESRQRARRALSAATQAAVGTGTRVRKCGPALPGAAYCIDCGSPLSEHSRG